MQLGRLKRYFPLFNNSIFFQIVTFFDLMQVGDTDKANALGREIEELEKQIESINSSKKCFRVMPLTNYI